VYAGCAIMDFKRLKALKKQDRDLVRDSKQLSPQQRAYVVPILEKICTEWYVASASVQEIERIGIVQACFVAMRRALSCVKRSFDLVLIDGKQKIGGHDGEQMAVIKGDFLCYSIAAASILAKEARDDYMRFQATKYPEYGFDAHVGYATKQHMDSIAKHGVCALHRRNFEPIRSQIATPLFADFGEPGRPLAQ
jgi:ribonuclease HII